MHKEPEKDLYEILGVSSTATSIEIQAAYRRAAMKWHPDRHQDEASKKIANEKIKIINNANRILSDPLLKAEYDLGRNQRTGSAGWQSSGPYNWRQSWQAHNQRTEENERKAKEEERRQWQQRRPKGRDIKKSASITIEQALNGGVIIVKDSVWESCPECFGGAFSKKKQICPKCNGARYGMTGPCRMCGGKGTVCSVCEDKLEIQVNLDRKIKIKPGCVEGTVLTVPELGYPSDSGGLNGDMLITIKVKSASGWSVKGADLNKKVKIPYHVAMFGGKIDLVLPTGTRVEVNVPPRSNSGTKIRLAGMGLRPANTPEVGNVILTVEITLPHGKLKVPKEVEDLVKFWKL